MKEVVLRLLSRAIFVMALCVSGWLAWANTSVQTRVIAKSNHNFVFAPDTVTPIWPNDDTPLPNEGEAELKFHFRAISIIPLNTILKQDVTKSFKR